MAERQLARSNKLLASCLTYSSKICTASLYGINTLLSFNPLITGAIFSFIGGLILLGIGYFCPSTTCSVCPSFKGVITGKPCNCVHVIKLGS